MIPFPAVLAPPAPFPLVIAQTKTESFVAPGIRRADYHLLTNLGPLVLHIVAIDPGEPTVRIGVVVARDRLVSSGERISAMAARTGAVAGINADYYDIGQTNQPLNLVVRDGVLLRTPSKRATMLVGPRNAVTFGSFAFSGTATWPGGAVPLTTINEFPPQGGAGLVTADFGANVSSATVTAATLAPGIGTVAGLPGTYQVTAVGPAPKGPVNAPFLAFGPAALRLAAPPNVGDDVTIAYATIPLLAGVRSAVGGGPLLLANGVAIDDPNAPAPEEPGVRFPLAGAGTVNDGTIALLAVDGRKTAGSIGLTRPEFAALFAGFGATNALAFDSGGSATLVGRVLGDARASVLNVPSDGAERPVADGIFAYSDAAPGPPKTLVARPATFVALPGIDAPIQILAVDAAGHPAPGSRVEHVIASAVPGDHTVTIENGGLALAYPYRTVTKVATLKIAPALPNPEPNGTVALTVSAAAADGTPVVVGAPQWHADRGGFRSASAQAIYAASTRDATVTATVGGLSASAIVRVGHRQVPLALFAPDARPFLFSTAPTGLAGSVTMTPSQPPMLSLGYDFTGVERASYANTMTVLPETPLGFAVETDDTAGLLIRGSFQNNLGERRAFTLSEKAKVAADAAATAPGWRTIGIDFPSDLYPPVTLLALYVAPQTNAVRAPGTIRFRLPYVVLPGTP